MDDSTERLAIIGIILSVLSVGCSTFAIGWNLGVEYQRQVMIEEIKEEG